MFLPLRFRARAAAAWPLGALLFMSSAPARAQSASGTPATPAKPVTPTAPPLASPQLTVESRPSSAIAGTQRPGVVRIRQRRTLLMAAPVETLGVPNPIRFEAPVGAPTVGATPISSAKVPIIPVGAIPGSVSSSAARGAGASATALSGSATPQTLISPAKHVSVTSKTRFDASRVTTQGPETPPAATVAAPAAAPQAFWPVAVGAPLPISPSVSVAAPVTASSAATTSSVESLTSPRDRVSRPASRGGLMSNRAPVELEPRVPDTGAISDSQRRLLASLDADLGRAQRRLDRAETSLSEGQRQLGAFTGVLQTAMLDAGPDARGLHPFVRVAQRYMGTPYVWGGESARGFDCSGFIMRVMRDLGYRALPHSAAEQFGYGLPVAKALLKPGDIVFFANTYKPGISHVGIYLGRGRFIHAANSKVGTIVSNLDSPKWVEHYAGARRLLQVKS